MSLLEQGHQTTFKPEGALPPHFADLRATLEQARDPFAVFSRFLAGYPVRGFHYLRLWRPGELDSNPPASALFQRHSYPAEWGASLAESRFFAQDPTVALLRRGGVQTLWQSSAPVPPEAQESRLHACDLGLVSGASFQLFSGRRGAAALGLWCAPHASAADFGQFWATQGPALMQAGQIFDQVLRAHRPNALIGLTPRELDCLRGLFCGHRTSEICWQLNLSDRTFEKHICNAKVKLKARTRDQALAKAVMLDLL